MEVDLIYDKKNLKNHSLLLLFLVTTLALFYPVLNFEYLDYDDQFYIISDLATKQLSLANLKTIFLEPYFAAWYPLTRLSHAIEYAVFGDTATGTHLINMLLHFLNAAILLQILMRLGELTAPEAWHKNSIRYAAVVATVLFIVHPQHVEAVAWAVQRKELLATLFALLSITMYLKRRLFAAGVFVALAMLSKASTVMLPVLFVLFDIALAGQKNMGLKRLTHALLKNGWIIVLALTIAALTFMHHHSESVFFYQEFFPLLTRLLLYADNSLHGIFHFFTLQAELFHLPVSEYVIAGKWLGITFLVLMVVSLVTCSVLIFTGSRKIRVGAAGLLFYFTALLPVAGFVVFGNYAFGDRYMYFSSIGIYVLVFICLCELFNRFSGEGAKRWLSLILGIVILAAFMQSQRILPKWVNTESIWAYDVERRPDSVFANNALGEYYFFRGNNELAYPYFEATIESDSNRFRIGPRTSSALYMAEIMCDADKEERAIGILGRIPEFGGDMRNIEILIASLRHSEYQSCAQAISDWYESVADNQVSF